MSWDAPDYVDQDELDAVAEEMGFLYEGDKSYVEHLDQDTDVTVYTPARRIADYLDPYATEGWGMGEGGKFLPAMDLHTRAPFDGEKMGPEPWQDHIAVLVGHLDAILPDLQDQYQGSGALAFPDIIRLEVYNRIVGFKNPPQLRSHLLRSQGRDGFPIHKILGFDSVPHQNTIRNARKNRIGPRASQFITSWASRIETIGIRRGYRFPDVDDQSLVNNGGIIDIPVELKRGYSQGALDLARDHMPIEKQGNPIWTDYGIHFDYSLHLCHTGGAPEAELENFADNRGLQMGEDIFQTAETFRNDIDRVSIWEWVSTLNEWTDNILDAVYPPERRALSIPIAIDSTNIPTWSSEQSSIPGVLGTKKMANTHYAYQILSAQAVSDGMPFQIAHQLQVTTQDRAGRLMSLLDEVENRGFNIGVLMADSEFAPGEIVNELKHRGTDFIIQIPNHWVSSYTDALEDQNKTFGSFDAYTMNEGKGAPKETTNALFCSYEHLWGKEPATLDAEDAPDTVQKSLHDLTGVHPEAEWATGRQTAETGKAIIDEDDEHGEDEGEGAVDYGQKNAGWLSYITSFDINDAEARTLREYYKYRWSIESSYGTYKESFLPKTKSMDLKLRTYLYLFGMAAYNSWIAANVKARRQHLQDSDRYRPPIRARRFLTLGQQRYRNEEFPTDYINFREESDTD